MHEKLFANAGLSLERLKTFVEIVSAGGITPAASGDANRQSQFSRQLKELEEFFGAELARRGRGRFALTAVGRRLHDLAQSHLAALAELRQECDHEPVELRVGAGESVIQWFVLPSLPKLRVTLQGAVFILQNLKSREIAEQLSDGRIDIGLVRADAIPASLRSSRLFTLEYRVFAPVKAHEAKQPSDSRSLLEAFSWAVLEGDGRVTCTLRDEARSCGARLDELVACSSFTQAAEAVRTLGVAAILPAQARTLFEPGKFAKLNPAFLAPLARSLSVAWNPRMARIRPMVSRAAKAFSQMRER